MGLLKAVGMISGTKTYWNDARHMLEWGTIMKTTSPELKCGFVEDESPVKGN